MIDGQAVSVIFADTTMTVQQVKEPKVVKNQKPKLQELPLQLSRQILHQTHIGEFDPQSNYYFDTTTGYYDDYNSGFYCDSSEQQYLHYGHTLGSYIPSGESQGPTLNPLTQTENSYNTNTRI